jgi:hypothetical protein
MPFSCPTCHAEFNIRLSLRKHVCTGEALTAAVALPTSAAVFEQLEFDCDETLEFVLSDNSSAVSSTCGACGCELVCTNPKCRCTFVDPFAVDEPEDQPVQKDALLQLGALVDIHIGANVRHIDAVRSDNSVVRVLARAVTVRDYKHVNREGRNWFPLLADAEFRPVVLSAYNIRATNAAKLYGHAAGPKRIYRKIVADNGL